MSEKSMEERMATLEANVTATMALTARIDGKLDKWRDEHFTKEEVREMLKARDERVEELREAFQNHLTQEQSNKQNSKINGFQWALIVFAGLSSFGSIALVIVTVTTQGHP